MFNHAPSGHFSGLQLYQEPGQGHEGIFSIKKDLASFMLRLYTKFSTNLKYFLFANLNNIGFTKIKAN